MNREQPDTTVTASPAQSVNAGSRRTKLKRLWSMFRKAPLSAWFGLVVIFSYIFVALFAPWLAPHGE
ncbi:MAG TPA: hypothetical protein VM260_09090, partial [Pirellula sp.]|nr:hypothetical protein [Pirellula sp.]